MLRIGAFLLLSLFGFQLHGQPTAIQSAIDEAEMLFIDFRAKNKIPGTAVAVMKDGKLVWSKGLGFADLEHQVKVDPGKTLFRIGSVSKPFTAAALGLLYEAGKIDLDVPIQEYVPDFPEKDFPITLRQLAGHLAGIRHYRGDEFLSTQYYPTVAEGLDIFAADDLLFEPGTQYVYSSYGWNLISAAIEQAAGEPFLSYMEKNVFWPLSMYNTAADYANQIIVNRSECYAKDNNGEAIPAPFVDNSYKWAGGGFIASAEDVARFGSAHLTEKLLKTSTIQEWISPQTLKNGKSTAYGIGWRSGKTDDGYAWFGHSGGSVGGITQLIVFPDQKLVVAMVTNTSPVNYDGAHFAIARCFMR